MSDEKFIPIDLKMKVSLADYEAIMVYLRLMQDHLAENFSIEGMSLSSRFPDVLKMPEADQIAPISTTTIRTYLEKVPHLKSHPGGLIIRIINFLYESNLVRNLKGEVITNAPGYLFDEQIRFLFQHYASDQKVMQQHLLNALDVILYERKLGTASEEAATEPQEVRPVSVGELRAALQQSGMEEKSADRLIKAIRNRGSSLFTDHTMHKKYCETLPSFADLQQQRSKNPELYQESLEKRRWSSENNVFFTEDFLTAFERAASHEDLVRIFGYSPAGVSRVNFPILKAAINLALHQLSDS